MPSPSRTLLLVACSLALLCGCASTPEAEPASAPAAEPGSGSEQAAAPAAAPVPDRTWHMQETFWMAVRARDAIMAGDLEAARNAARELQHHQFAAALPERWKHWTAQMQQEAQAIVIAGSLGEAAQHVAALAQSCGSCHWEKKAGPDAPRAEAVPWEDPPDTLTERMDRHFEGVEQLWQGMVQPSEEAWRNGTITITRAPLSAPVVSGGEVTPEGHAAVEKARELARRARAARSHGERAQIFGELITGCASCHATAAPAPQ